MTLPPSVIFFAVLIALALIGIPLMRVLIAMVAGRAVGRAALAKQPDRIHLVEAAPLTWKDPAGADRLTEPLSLLGYEKAGMYSVAEMPGVVVRLLVHLRERVMGVVYEHPAVGQWVELITLYGGGTSCSVTSSADNGLAPRPGHPVTHLPGTDPAALHARLLAIRPPAGTLSIEAARAAEVFCDGFAESMAWRKAHGISRGEVVKVAVRFKVKKRAA